MAAFICWIGWSRRIQHLQFIRLQEMQKQLREQMERVEELAATRERVRIARDIHDVLAHSLTVLSIQVQATRQLVQQPERVAAKLDDMAALLRESLAESRRVVTLWRETASAATSYGNVVTRLQAALDRFSERTGIQGVFEEKGTAHPLNDQQCETLQYVLQETLTNAHRHGAAQHIQAELQWQDIQVILQVHDDGKGQDTISPPQTGTLHGHHGLQGMRERATALGGTLQAGPRKAGGFAVTLSLPFEKAKQLQKGKQ
ncbi:hypothetical protein KDAU_61580 [Dictyobacter aurantiacus]|uniref:Uncharacterized protein n=2 Tax=Dictyobacter aurantiacus TaxID=1936993 RepID=A0A401ZPM3_9CHLR|nr:hypothetical protein KDAU_61580 [Dictyobacter aurantiacus]